MIAIELDTTGDLALRNGTTATVSGAACARQHIQVSLDIFLGEWFLDQRKGVSYFRDVLIHSPNPETVRSVIRAAIMLAPGIVDVLSLDVDLDYATNAAHVVFIALYADGTEIKESVYVAYNPVVPAVTPLTIIKSVTVLQWLRADLGVAIASGVSVWADQSGNSHHHYQGSGPAQPAYIVNDATLNNQSTIYASAASAQQLVNTTLPLASPIWMSGIGLEWVRANAALWGSINGQPETADLYDGVGTGNMNAYSGVTYGVVSSGVILPINTWKRFEVNYSVASAGYMRVGNSNPTRAGTSNMGTNAAIGSSIFSTTGAAFWTGKIAERVVCSGRPTNAEIDALDAYYTARYGAGLV